MTVAPTPDILLCGDFNLPHAIWPAGLVRTGASKDEKVMISDLKELTDEFCLEQYIDQPTHKLGNTLDLVFSNNPQFIHSYQCNQTLYSDHYIIEGKVMYTQPNRPKLTDNEPSINQEPGAMFDLLNFFSDDTNWNGIEMDLRNYNWVLEFRQCNPKEMLDRFINVCCSISKEHVPLRRNSKKSAHNIPRNRRILMRKRCRINRQLVKTTSQNRKYKLQNEAKDIEKELRQCYEDDREHKEQKAISAIKKNSKYFFNYAKKFSQIKIGIGPLIDRDKNVVNDDKAMADMLAAQYESVYSVPNEPMKKPYDIYPEKNDDRGLYDVYFTQDDIIEAISEISATSAAGPDRFPAILLKKCSDALSTPLFMIWRDSLDGGSIPELMKSANIVPIHKGGSRGVPKQYRPVALTSHLIKLFEKIIRKHIIAYLEENNLLNPNQHGFRLGRSCLSQLLAHFENILRLLEKGDNVDVIYLDFAKAFDKVDFQVAMQKLKSLGISGKLGRWIYSFLTGRTQTVVVNGARSESSSVTSGVPQGSVLGPLLFLVLIGDIDSNVTSSFVSSFADDTRIGRQIGKPKDTEELQSDLNLIYDWANENNMQFNSDKFECLRYGRNKTLQSTEYISNSDNLITVKLNTRDLGIIMSNDGSFQDHISNIIATARNMCGWILRTFRSRSPHLMLTLWKTMVLSKLDYCCQLWSPLQRGSIQALEQVQRTFIRKIDGTQHLSYWEKLIAYRLYSLYREKRAVHNNIHMAHN